MQFFLFISYSKTGFVNNLRLAREVTSQNSMKVAVDEDHLADGDNGYTHEQLDYIVFSVAGPVPLV